MSDLPSGWKFPRLDKLGEFKNGVNKSKDDFGHGKPLVNLNDIFGKNHLSSSAFLDLVDVNEQEIANYSLIAGDVLFVRSSVKPEGVGLTAVVLEDMPETVYSGFIIRFRNGGKIDKNFARYCFYENRFRHNLMSKSTISANTNINQPALGSMQIPLPPLPEQRAIARILSTWDEAIALVGALIDALTLRKRGLMQVLLTGKVRFPGFEDEWEEVRLGDVVKEFIVPMRDKPKKFMGEIPWCRIEDFDGIYLSDSKSGQYVDENIINQMNLKVFPSGSLLVSCSADLGRCAITTRPLITNQTFIGLVTSELIDTLFLYYLMSSSSHQLNRLSSGTTIAYLSRKEFEKFRVRIPQTLAEQIQIAELLSSLDGAIDDATLTRTHLQRQKKGLMQVLLTGKVRVDGIGEDT
jgi:type I restriction enzyme S subunit